MALNIAYFFDSDNVFMGKFFFYFIVNSVYKSTLPNIRKSMREKVFHELAPCFLTREFQISPNFR